VGRNPGVHEVESATSASVSWLFIADLGTNSGETTLSEGKARVTSKLTPTYAYTRGNSSGLRTLFGLTAAQAKKVGKDWVSIEPATALYVAFKSRDTISSLAGDLPEAKGTTF